MVKRTIGVYIDRFTLNYGARKVLPVIEPEDFGIVADVNQLITRKRARLLFELDFYMSSGFTPIGEIEVVN